MITCGSYVEIISVEPIDKSFNIRIGDIFKVVDDDKYYPFCIPVISECSECLHVFSMQQLREA